jgi:type I phosphodiesterase/nucleotide pyrophosphatase
MSEVPQPPIPNYGSASLAELTPSLMAALGAPGFENALAIEPASAVCLLLVDGFGWDLLLEWRAEAPFLASLVASGRPISAGFPASTVPSLASLGTGVPPGEHGMTGYSMAIPPAPGQPSPGAMNCVTWRTYDRGPARELRSIVIPEEIQVVPTIFERLAGRESGAVSPAVVGPAEHEGSGMTRAILRGAPYVGIDRLPDDIPVVARLLAGEPAPRHGPTARSGRPFVYAYHPDLDLAGHVFGPGSDEWRAELRVVDRIAAGLAGALPHDGLLAITGDHGMMLLPPEGRYDPADIPALADGVRFLAGEPRARHVHTVAGAEADVLAAWRDLLRDGMWIASRDEALEAGWFGPRVAERTRARIGDVVAAAFGPVGVVDREVDPGAAGLLGQHGSMTSAERLVPLLEVRR